MAKILIVDDEESIRMLFHYTFSDAGHTVETAENGRVALEKFDTFVPDFILLDIAMPEMTGPEFVKNWDKKALTRPELRDIPFMVMTGENYLNPTVPLGFGDKKNFKSFVAKMTNPDDVLAMVKGILDKAGKS